MRNVSKVDKMKVVEYWKGNLGVYRNNFCFKKSKFYNDKLMPFGKYQI